MLSVNVLREARALALRKRVWYRVLDGLDRGIINLTLRSVECVKSPRLTGIVVSILDVLREACRSAFTRLLDSYGYDKMSKVIQVALSFGSTRCLVWSSEALARLLTLNNMYSPIGWQEQA
jgi:hypothetical protein